MCSGDFLIDIILKSLFDGVQKTEKQNTTTGLRTCNNILAMTKVNGMICQRILGYIVTNT